VRNDGGAPACLEMIAENVTKWHRAKKRIEQLNRLYTVLTHANQSIVRTRERSMLFQEICRIIIEEGGFQMAWLGLVEPGTGMVPPLASYPPEEEYLDDIRISVGPEPEGRGPVGTAIRENRHVVCNDLTDDPSMAPWRQRALRRSFRSLAAFPVVNHGRSIGAMVIYAAETDFFDIENVALLSELAADVSFAVESIESEQMHQRVAADLDQFFAVSLDMLFISDLDGYMHRMNPAWEKKLGYTAAEMCAKPWIEFVHPEDRTHVLQAHERLRSGAEVRDLELRFRSKSGSLKWLVACASPDLDRGVVFAAVSDITERKKLEERLRSQNLILEERNHRIEAASRMKSEFLANMSHELRSPLNGIIGFTELLYDGKLGELPARPKGYVGRIHASASHLLQLINGVLDLSKIEAGHLEFCPERLLISRVIHEVTGILGVLAAGKQIQIETEMESGVDEVMIDEGRLRQVLYNYLSNALKFTGDGGRVVVRLKSEGAAAFRLEVSDTGIGVSEKDLPRLFVEFQQLDATTAKRYQGTGLGLALTKRIVEAQGGRVGVASRSGRGSTFFAVLPRVPRSASAPDGSARILVVDDQNLDLVLLSHILQSNGYLVETAETGDEAYEKCRREQFDAITLDLVLEDQPGWEVLARIRSLEKYRHIPVIVISGCERADLEVPIAVEGFLTKPVCVDDLLGALRGIGLPKRGMQIANG
jgi:PAS domain S-box-containing protein